MVLERLGERFCFGLIRFWKGFVLGCEMLKHQDIKQA